MQLLSITELYLNDTFLEFLPANFGRLSRLRILELRENSLGTLPKSLSRLSDLRRLDMGNNDLAEVPEVVGSLPELRELWLDGNRELQDRSIDLKHLIYPKTVLIKIKTQIFIYLETFLTELNNSCLCLWQLV